MAVFTKVSDAELAAFLADYDIGAAREFAPIAEGIENSNYRLQTEKGQFVLTLFERRTPADALPFVVGLMRHLEARGAPVPRPIPDRRGDSLKTLNDRPALIVSFLGGRSLVDPGIEACRAAGTALARLHLAAVGYDGVRANPFGLEAWPQMAASCAHKADAAARSMLAALYPILDRLKTEWPQHLPKGPCHADLFPDNAFFSGERVSGLIDFYFSCEDLLAYDLAVMLASWCFAGGNRYDPARAAAMTEGYDAARPLEGEERSALPLLCLGAAMRFTLTRLYDRLHPREDALVVEKDPQEFYTRLMHFDAMTDAGKGLY